MSTKLGSILSMLILIVCIVSACGPTVSTVDAGSDTTAAVSVDADVVNASADATPTDAAIASTDVTSTDAASVDAATEQ